MAAAATVNITIAATAPPLRPRLRTVTGGALAPMPYARFRFAAAAAQLEAYAFGGAALCWDTASGAANPGNAAFDASTPQCQASASATASVFYELDHPDVFVQVAAARVGAPEVTEQALSDAAATDGAAVAGGTAQAAGGVTGRRALAKR